MLSSLHWSVKSVCGGGQYCMQPEIPILVVQCAKLEPICNITSSIPNRDASKNVVFLLNQISLHRSEFWIYVCISQVEKSVNEKGTKRKEERMFLPGPRIMGDLSQSNEYLIWVHPPYLIRDCLLFAYIWANIFICLWCYYLLYKTPQNNVIANWMKGLGPLNT